MVSRREGMFRGSVVLRDFLGGWEEGGGGWERGGGVGEKLEEVVGEEGGGVRGLWVVTQVGSGVWEGGGWEGGEVVGGDGEGVGVGGGVLIGVVWGRGDE